MSEKPPVFTVTDRRKFTLEGELRDEAAQASQPEEAKKPEPAAQPASEPAPDPGPRLVTAPSQKEAAAPESSSSVAVAEAEEDTETPPEVSAQDEAAAQHAYQQSSEHIGIMLRAANPGSDATPVVSIEHVIQSVYLSAIVALGAAAEPGQKPRIDILGARQSIDMLGVLQEKTKGNLSEKEQRLLQNALFETRMMFLEVTNAIAQQAARPPQEKK
jgi:hypothetical protein